MEIIGHRGAKGLAPENTIAGIKFALTRGVDWIEIDVRSTKDKQVVVLHDQTLRRVAHDRGRANQYTLAELQAIATKSGEPIPSLEEVMTVIKDRAKLDIELKDKQAAPIVVKIIENHIAKGRVWNDFLVSSLTIRPLRAVQKLQPKIHLAYLHRLWPFTFLLLSPLKLSAVGFFGLAAPKLAINQAKKRQLWIMIYTVNHRSLVERFAKLGADAVITDMPQALLPLKPVIWRWLISALLVAGILLLLAYYIL